MKFVVFLSVIVLLSMGCASMNGISKEEFMEWTKANVEIAKINADVNSRPTFELNLTPDGKVAGIKTYAQPNVMPFMEQKRPSEWVGTVNRLLSIGGYLGGAAIIGDAVKDMVDSSGKNAGHNTTTTGSYNTDRHDITTTTSTTNTTSGSYNGDYRDVSGSVSDDHSNRSINNSYNPIDRHDVNGAMPEDYQWLAPPLQ